jgi:hypothetical protein
VIVETEHPVSYGSQIRIADRVASFVRALKMLPPVDLDDDICCV